jgi:hypothetical protein
LRVAAVGPQHTQLKHSFGTRSAEPGKVYLMSESVRANARISKGVIGSLLVFVRALQREMPLMHVPSVLADYACAELLARARTREQAFDFGHTAGYVQAVSEISQVGIELLVCTLLHAEDAKMRAAILKEIAELSHGWTGLK